MDKKFFLALILAAGVIAVTPILFPSPKTPPVATAKANIDSVKKAQQPVTNTLTRAAGVAVAAAPLNTATIAESLVVKPETTLVTTPKSIYKMTNMGAAPLSVTMADYENRALMNGSKVDIGLPNKSLIKYQLVFPQDTVSLSNVPFASKLDGNILEYSANVRNVPVAITYIFQPDSYTVRVNGKVGNGGGNTSAYLLIDLPTGFHPVEGDTIDDQRHLAYAYKPTRENASSIRFDKLPPGERKVQEGPLTWVAAKNKYFVVGLLAPNGDTPFDAMAITGGALTSKIRTNGIATVAEPVKNGQFAFEIYVGPQEWKRLVAQGRDFEHVNPYGWSLIQGIVQPLASIVIRLLLWMHQTLFLSYGWVLVILGLAIRLAMWPMQQKAMRTSLKMQDLQPKIIEVQKKYQNDRLKQQEEMMKVYKEAGTSPFAALSGCLPVLLPMPILFALFFVFQNTIEFRGVPFLWLSDISIKDPYYILPVLMGASMFLLSWIGMKSSQSAASNPQAKMMTYVFPIVMTFILLNMASGLNLYYTVQNLAALPQQWLIARERKKASEGNR